MTSGKRFKGVLFDLDGTLLDTAPDMAAALNQLLREENGTMLEYERLRPTVSHGARGLINAGFGATIDAGLRERLTERFLEIYAAALANETAPFAGVEQVLAALEESATPWGIVTNKPGWLTRPLLDGLDFAGTAVCVICGDSLPERKPHPEPLLHAARLLDTHPAECIYVGDAERDIEAGRAAGMTTIIAGYGYIPDDEFPQQWQADGYIDHAHELMEWLNNR